METLADRMALVLKELNINQYEFAEQVGVGANYLSMIVRGKRVSISLSLARLIQEMFGYSEVWLLKGMGEKLTGSKPKHQMQIKPKRPAFRKNLEKIIDKMTSRQVEIVSMYARYVYSQKKKTKQSNA